MAEITKQDALRWLEMQRDAINTEIAYAAPSDKGQYFGNLRVVNWLVDRVKDLSAVEYIKVKNSMCEADACINCLLARDGYSFGCAITERDNPRRAVEIVKRWKEEQDG